MRENSLSWRGLAAFALVALAAGLGSAATPTVALGAENSGEQFADFQTVPEPTQWHELSQPLADPTPDSGETLAGQITDTHSATVQLVIGPETAEKNSVCSGAWVAGDRILTAKHCFETFPSGPVRVYPENSQVRGASYLSVGKTWASPDSGDLAMLITEPASHANAEIDVTPLAPSTPLQICGQNYLVSVNTDFNGMSEVIGGKGNFCANVATLDAANADKWQVPADGNIIATLPLAIEHGDSGGPLYSQAGKLVGITSSKTQVTLTNGDTLVFNNSVPLRPYANWLAQMGVPVPGIQTPLPAKALPANVMRVYGSNRLATSAAVVAATPGAETLLITTGLNAADGLSATQLSGVTSAALVLSNSRDHLDAEAINAINSFGFKRVVRVGGTVGISASDRALIASRGMEFVELVGTNRFDTAVKVAQYGERLSGEKPRYVLLADGINFPDALAAGAAAGLGGASLVLTSGNALPPQSAAYLGSQGGVPVVTVGGPAERAANAAGVTPKFRFTGEDRYATAWMVASSLDSGVANGLVFVSGRNFPDALSAGAYTVKQGAALVLVPPAGSKMGLLTELWKTAGQHGVIVGGPGAISDQDVAYAIVP